MKEIAFKVNRNTFVALYNILEAFDLTPNHERQWAINLLKNRQSIGWVYLDKYNHLSGFDWDNVNHSVPYYREIVDTTRLELTMTIIIDGKEIPLSKESYYALKKSLEK